MKYIILFLFSISAAASEITVVHDGGENCAVPDGYNAGPFDDTYNKRGMDPVCTWPHKPATDALLALIEQCKADTLPDLPRCNDGLTVSPGKPVRPCYEIVE